MTEVRQSWNPPRLDLERLSRADRLLHGAYGIPVFGTQHFPEFLLTVFVLISVPGPSVLFVVSRALALERRAALATVLGNAAGLAIQVLMVALGVGAIVAESTAVFTAIKLVGAAYLVVLGIRVIRDRRKLSRIIDTAIAPRAGRRILREGFIVGATNLKAVIIFTAVLPQFVSRDAVWRTRSQLELAVVEYVGWYNAARLHESLGYIPPAEHEQLHARRRPIRLEGAKV